MTAASTGQPSQPSPTASVTTSTDSMMGQEVGRGRAVAVTVAFVASLLWVVLVPVCGQDAASAEDFVHAAGQVGSPAVIVIHPPWREDAAAAIRDRAIKALSSTRVTTAWAPRHRDPAGAITRRDHSTAITVLRDHRFALPRAWARWIVDARRLGAVEIVTLVPPRGNP